MQALDRELPLYTVKCYNDYLYRVVKRLFDPRPSKSAKLADEEKPEQVGKFDSALFRAKNTVRELALCNKFDTPLGIVDGVGLVLLDCVGAGRVLDTLLKSRTVVQHLIFDASHNSDPSFLVFCCEILGSRCPLRMLPVLTSKTGIFCVLHSGRLTTHRIPRITGGKSGQLGAYHRLFSRTR